MSKLSQGILIRSSFHLSVTKPILLTFLIVNFFITYVLFIHVFVLRTLKLEEAGEVNVVKSFGVANEF